MGLALRGVIVVRARAPLGVVVVVVAVVVVVVVSSSSSSSSSSRSSISNNSSNSSNNNSSLRNQCYNIYAYNDVRMYYVILYYIAFLDLGGLKQINRLRRKEGHMFFSQILRILEIRYSLRKCFLPLCIYIYYICNRCLLI